MPVAQRSVVEFTTEAFRKALQHRLLELPVPEDDPAALVKLQANLSALLQQADLGAKPVQAMRCCAMLAASLDGAVRDLTLER